MIQGSLVALVTPMAENGAVDFECLRSLVEWHVQQGTDAIVSVGTTGESATLDEEEHCEVIRRTIEFVAGRVPVIAGTGANSTSEAIHLTRRAKAMGADGCLLVTPYYNKPTQEGLYLHYQAVAEAVAIPQILYNVPGRTACDMKPETVARIAELPNVIGVKEATGDLARVALLRELCGESFALYSGDDATALEFILRGGNGVISVTANLVPARMHRMCMAAIDGDKSVAQAIDDEIAPLHQQLFVESNPIPVKWALAEMGMIPAGIRLPLTPLSPAAQPQVRDAMTQAGLI